MILINTHTTAQNPCNASRSIRKKRIFDVRVGAATFHSIRSLDRNETIKSYQFIYNDEQRQ